MRWKKCRVGNSTPKCSFMKHDVGCMAHNAGNQDLAVRQLCVDDSYSLLSRLQTPLGLPSWVPKRRGFSGWPLLRVGRQIESCARFSEGHPSAIELLKFHLYPVSVSKLIGVTQPNVGGDLYDIPRVMSGASFVLIRPQQKRPAVKNPAWNDAHRHAPDIFIRFEAYGVWGKRRRRG